MIVTNYNLIVHLVNTQAGEIYICDEERSDRQVQERNQYYAYIFGKDFDKKVILAEKDNLSKYKYFRNFQKMIKQNQNIDTYLFTHVEGKTIENMIDEYKGTQTSFDMNKIKNYLTQLLEALYNLHQNNIMGRVFSTSNILDTRNGLVMLDFGFGPKILSNEELCILPPEILKQLIEQNYAIYDLQLDSWLVGAFLYDICKLCPINKICQQERLQYQEWILEKCKQNHLNITFQTKSYSQEFCELVESLLTFDTQKRLSFTQIYRNKFIQTLQIGDILERIDLYEKLENPKKKRFINLQNQILIRERKHLVVDTGNLKNNPQDQQSIIINKNQNENKLKNKEKVQQDVDQSQQFIINVKKNQNLQLSKQQKFISIYIKMEFFKYSLLNQTANQVVKILAPPKEYELEYLVFYCFKKMGLLILNNLLQKLNQANYTPWKRIDIQDWNDFQQKEKYEYVNFLEEILLQEKEILIGLFNNYCYDFLQDLQINQDIRNSLQNDIEQNLQFKMNYEQFLYNGYRDVTQNLFHFLKRQCVIYENDQLSQQKFIDLQLLCTFCHLINKIFELDSINTQFKNIKLPIYEDYISPELINDFIISGNKYQKQQEINQMIAKYFLV